MKTLAIGFTLLFLAGCTTMATVQEIAPGDLDKVLIKPKISIRKMPVMSNIPEVCRARDEQIAGVIDDMWVGLTEYDRELTDMNVRMLLMQQWAKDTKVRVKKSELK